MVVIVFSHKFWSLHENVTIQSACVKSLCILILSMLFLRVGSHHSPGPKHPLVSFKIGFQLKIGLSN